MSFEQRNKKHQRLARLVALAPVYPTFIISAVTRGNGRTKIMFLVIVANNVSVSWLSRLVVVISVFCCRSKCLVLCYSNIIVSFLLTLQKLHVHVDNVFLRSRFFHNADDWELSFNIVHEQWPRGRGKYTGCMATSCNLWVQNKRWLYRISP